MSRDSASLLDIDRAGRLVLQFSQGVDRESLESDLEKQSAILYQIAVIGEAVKRLSNEFRSQHPDIPWSDIAGMRDILTHQYDRVEFEVVWEAIQIDVPELLSMIEPLLP